MPIKVIHGTLKGPCLLIFSILNGTELNGLEIANRVTKDLDAKKIKGTVISIPVVNVYGLTHYPSMPPVNSNITNCFPGNENGSFGERIAHLFTHEILKKANYCIELQTGGINHNILPQVYCNFDNVEAKKLANIFGAPVVTNTPIEGNNLRQTTEQLHIPLLVYQAGEAMRFDDNSINLGVSGVKNIMRELNILEKSPEEIVKPIFSQDEDWILAHKGGILHTDVSLGQTIKKGEIIGRINDPFGLDNYEKIKSIQEGVVVGINTSPLIYEGSRIFKIASFLDYDRAESIIEKWDKEQPDSYIS